MFYPQSKKVLVEEREGDQGEGRDAMPLHLLKQAMLLKDRELFDTLRASHWSAICEQMCAEEPGPGMPELLHSRWTEYGGRIRADTGDDELLARALRAWLPKYEGPDLVLYRGESIERYEAGKVGFGWTPQRHTAEMFGSGLNAAYPGGGCLLQCFAPSAAILAPPSSHSLYLGESEYVVDPAMLQRVVFVERYARGG